MAVYKRDIIDINLETGNIYRSWLKHSIGYKDQKADHFGVRVFRDGEAVSLTGVSVQGVFMPPQGSPIAITSGNIVSGNVAEVVLPQACYNYDGQFTLAIKLVDSTNSVTGTVRIVDGMVDNTHASGTVAPTSAVPTYQEVLSVYEQAIVVIGKSVRFDTDQSLTDTQKTTARTNIAAASTGELSDLKSALDKKSYDITGNIAYTYTSNGYIALNGTTADITDIHSPTDYEYAVVPCKAGDEFYVTAKGQNATRAWAFVKANGTVCDPRADANTGYTNHKITAPADAVYLVSNNNPTFTGFERGVIVKNKPIKDDVGTNKTNIINLQSGLTETDRIVNDGFIAASNGGYVTIEQIDSSSLTNHYAINSSGAEIWLDNSYAIRSFIGVDAGTVIKAECNLTQAPSDTGYMYVFFYSAANESSYLSREGGQIQSPYTKEIAVKVPSTAKYFRVSLSYVGNGNVSSFSCKIGYEFAQPFSDIIQPYLKGKNGIILGDSISYGLYSYWNNGARYNSDGLSPDYASKRISDYFADLAGMTVTNIAKRGTGYVADSRNLGNALVKANATDFSQYAFVGLCYGINDYLQNKTIGAIETSVEGTVIGNMMRVLQKIYNDNPLAKVVIFSPYNAWGQVAVNQQGDELYGDFASNYALGHQNTAGYTLQDLVDAIDSVAQYYGITHEKLNKSNVVNRLNIKDIMIDGLHPSLDSMPMLAAEMFAQKDFG